MQKTDIMIRAAVAAMSLTFVLGGTAVVAHASSPVYTNDETGYEVYIDDSADLLSDSEEKKLMIEMQPVTDYGGAAFVSSDDVDDGMYQEYAEERYYNYFENNSGALFLIDMSNRQIYLCTNGEIYNIVTSDYATTITDNAYTYATDGDYYGCAAKVFRQAGTLLRGGRISQPMKYITNALLAVIVALLINFVLVRIRGRKIKASKKELLAATLIGLAVTGATINLLSTKKMYSPRDTGSGSSGGSSGGGGGGGGGGGFSGGGGGGHSF